MGSLCGKTEVNNQYLETQVKGIEKEDIQQGNKEEIENVKNYYK